MSDVTTNLPYTAYPAGRRRHELGNRWIGIGVLLFAAEFASDQVFGYGSAVTGLFQHSWAVALFMAVSHRAWSSGYTEGRNHRGN